MMNLLPLDSVPIDIVNAQNFKAFLSSVLVSWFFRFSSIRSTISGFSLHLDDSLIHAEYFPWVLHACISP